MDMILLVLQSVYFIVPAYFANMAPVIAKKLNILKSLDIPIDRGKNFADNLPFFGRNKTYRGIFAAVISGILLVYLQKCLYSIAFFRWISLTDYSSPLLLGFLLGLGAIIGDLIKSFFKRRIKIGSGKRWIPFDQLDFVIGAYLFVLPFYSSIISCSLSISSLLASFFLHITVNHISFYLGIRKEKW